MGAGGATGARTNGAHHSERSVFNALRRKLGFASDDSRLRFHPWLRSLWQERAGFTGQQQWGAAEPRGDISYTRADGAVLVCDLVITTPTASTHTQDGATAAEKAGTAAQVAYADKQTQYAARFDIPPNTFFPLAAESGGRLHPGVRTAIETIFIDHITATTGQQRSAWGKAEIQRDRKSTRLNSSHVSEARMPSSA